jgi:hypothetical protein
MASKAAQIIDHMTSDPQVKQDVLDAIAEIKANPGQHNLDTIIARFTSDPELTAKIKSIVGQVAKGNSMQAVADENHPDTDQVSAASEGMSSNRAAVEKILAS